MKEQYQGINVLKGVNLVVGNTLNKICVQYWDVWIQLQVQMDDSYFILGFNRLLHVNMTAFGVALVLLLSIQSVLFSLPSTPATLLSAPTHKYYVVWCYAVYNFIFQQQFTQLHCTNWQDILIDPDNYFLTIKVYCFISASSCTKFYCGVDV